MTSRRKFDPRAAWRSVSEAQRRVIIVCALSAVVFQTIWERTTNDATWITAVANAVFTGLLFVVGGILFCQWSSQRRTR